MKEDEVLALSEMMVFLANSRGTYNEQRKLTLLSIRGYLEDTANGLAAMWVNKLIDKENYHLLMGNLRSAWDTLNRVIREDFEIEEDFEIREHDRRPF